MRSKPSRISRALYRFPIWLYRMGLGWLLGRRMLYLRHTGRNSGLPRETVLEVVHHEGESDTYIIASAWGESADWYQNISTKPEIWLKVGSLSTAAIATPLPTESGERFLLKYAAKHPTALRTLSRFMGFEAPQTEQDVREIARQLPMVGITPAAEAEDE